MQQEGGNEERAHPNAARRALFIVVQQSGQDRDGGG